FVGCEFAPVRAHAIRTPAHTRRCIRRIMKAAGTCLAFLATLAATAALAREADTVALEVELTKPGAQISRHLFGQFAEHLGRGIYEGVWVGPDSPIPNTRGIR